MIFKHITCTSLWKPYLDKVSFKGSQLFHSFLNYFNINFIDFSNSIISATLILTLIKLILFVCLNLVISPIINYFLYILLIILSVKFNPL